jgi:hypothetical protein
LHGFIKDPAFEIILAFTFENFRQRLWGIVVPRV